MARALWTDLLAPAGWDWGSAPDWIVAVTAVAVAVYAGAQFRLTRIAQQSAAADQKTAVAHAASAADQASATAKAHAEQVEIARANMLIRLDEQYEGTQLGESRRAWLALRNRTEADVEQRLATHSENEQAVEVCRFISDYLSGLWSQVRHGDESPESQSARAEATNAYAVLMRLPNWFETVGHLCRRNLIPLNDIVDLYDQIVIKTIGYMSEHIERRRKGDIRATSRMLEHATWLLKESERHKQAREVPAILEPTRATLPWKVK